MRLASLVSSDNFAFCVATAYDFFMKMTAWIWGPASLVFVAVGCASPLTRARHENASLTQTVDELRSESLQRERKLRDMEKELALARAAVARRDAPTPAHAHTPEGAVAPAQLPELAVTVLAPATAAASPRERVVGVADDGSEIVYADDAMSAQTVAPDGTLLLTPVRRLNEGGSAHSVRPVPVAAVMARVRAPLRPQGSSTRTATAPLAPSAPVAPPSTRDSADAVAQYREGVAKLRAGEHASAITMLRNFLAAHPRHDYADNAQYWLGEAFYDQKDYARAASEFRATVDTYPQGNKVPDAMLKLGYSYVAQGDVAKGADVLRELVRLYPKTEPALLAQKRLETIQ